MLSIQSSILGIRYKSDFKTESTFLKSITKRFFSGMGSRRQGELHSLLFGSILSF